MNFNQKSEKIIGIILAIVSIILLGTVFYYLNVSIGLDEYFTLYKVVLQPFDKMMFSINNDVHPPLYYFILYSVFNILNAFGISYSPIIAGKIVSIIPIIILLIFNFTKLKNKFGWLFSGIFAIMIVSFPTMMNYATEIRMYSWGFLFITLAFYFAYEITKKSNWKNWIFLTIFTVFGIYTQYFATVILFSIYLILLLWLLNNHRKQLKKHSIPKSIKKWFISAILAIVAYVPWIFTLLYQLDVGNSEWIPLPTIDSVKRLIWFIFDPVLFNPVRETKILGIIFILSFIVLLAYYFLNIRKNDNKSFNGKNSNSKSSNNKLNNISFNLNNDKLNNFIIWGLLIFALFTIIAFVVSFSGHSIWRNRYFVLGLGILWMVYAYLLSKSYDKKIIFVPVLLIFLIVSGVTTAYYIDDEQNNIIALNEYNGFLQTLDDNHTTIITTNRYTYNIMHRYGPDVLKDNIHLFLKKVDINEEKAKDGKEFSEKYVISKIKKAYKKDNTIYLFTSPKRGQKFEKILNDNGFKLKLVKKLHKNGSDDGNPTVIYEIVKS
ncbi:MAG: glycosyltransferase family 39 protein [Methanobrevibacter sp.]|jgi:hypothetical protein|nr:glycosyltransferase family 39 protein [Candidatus Methanoflexus mossambicus]